MLFREQYQILLPCFDFFFFIQNLFLEIRNGTTNVYLSLQFEKDK
jgi:hypothetical protein